MQALYRNLTSKGPTGAFVLGILGVAIVLFSLINNSDTLSVADAAKQSESIAESGVLNIAFNITLLFLAICVIAIVLFAVMQLVSNPKSAMKFLAGLAIVAVLFFVSQSLFGGDENSESLSRLMAKFDVSEGQSSFITGAMGTTFALLAISAISFVVFEILNFFK